MMITRLHTANTLAALPDGEYCSNDIRPLHFVKKDGVVVLRNGRLKTFEQTAAYIPSVVGPLLDGRP